LLVRYRDRVDVEAIGVVEGVFGDALGVEGEEIADRLIVDIDADGVEPDEAADASGVIAAGHLGADPTTERRTDDEDIAQVVVPNDAIHSAVGTCEDADLVGNRVGAWASVPRCGSGSAAAPTEPR
jgi:hypothetical protein